MAGTMIGVEITGPSGELFRLEDYLGHGFFGEVYRAIGSSSGRVTAVKLIPSNVLQNPDAQTALLNEIRVASKITHPNVVHVLYVNTDPLPIGPYLMMEFISGGTLASILRSQRSAKSVIPLARAREMMIDIAQGTRAINECLIHRDIKPDNILIDDAHLKIGDFGISKVIDEQTRTLTFKGGQHVAYMAPEGWEGQANTFKLDVYSVGLVFYELLTLDHPLRQFVSDPSDWRSWREAHLFSICPDIRKMRPDVNPSVSQMITRMVNKRTKERPTWDEIISILSSNDEPSPVPNQLSTAVEIAINHQQQNETKLLVEQQKAEKEQRKNEFYRYSCDQLIDNLDEVVQQFNSQFQIGKISKILVARNSSFRYSIPTGGQISVSFFPRRETNIKIKGGALIGGGYIEIENKASGNLLLVRDGDDDFYGRWIACLMEPGAFANPAKLIGTRGITQKTKIPFGMKTENDFYEEMQFADGVMHVFTYQLKTDIKAFLVDVLETALSQE